jgi:hypothetical protein
VLGIARAWASMGVTWARPRDLLDGADDTFPEPAHAKNNTTISENLDTG